MPVLHPEAEDPIQDFAGTPCNRQRWNKSGFPINVLPAVFAFKANQIVRFGVSLEPRNAVSRVKH